MARQVIFADPVSDDDDGAPFRAVQAGEDLIVKEFVDTLETLGVVPIFDFQRIIDDDEISTETRHAALDRQRPHATASGGDKVRKLRTIFRHTGFFEDSLVPFTLEDCADGVGDLVGEFLPISQDDDLGRGVVPQDPGGQADRPHPRLEVTWRKVDDKPLCLSCSDPCQSLGEKCHIRIRSN